jgi:hypothetical protein
MRVLITLTVAMGVLILLGTTVLVVAIVKRSAAPPSSGAVMVTLDEPTGTRITGVAGVADQVAVALQGGGPDRLVLVDPRSGVIAGRISLRP